MRIQAIVCKILIIFRQALKDGMFVPQQQATEDQVWLGEEPIDHGFVEGQFAGPDMRPLDLVVVCQPVGARQIAQFEMVAPDILGRAGHQTQQHERLMVVRQVAALIAVEMQRCTGQ